MSSVRNILAINFNHDGSAVLLTEGRLAGYVNTERFSRLKKHPGVREADLNEVLAQAGIESDSVDLVILQNLSVIDSEEIVHAHGSDLKSTWPELNLDRTTGIVSLLGQRIPCVIDLDHFLCHCAAAYYFSPFEEAICFAHDPTGCGTFIGRGNTLVELDGPASKLGKLYAMVSRHLGFSALFGAGKVMGLAPYGREASEPVRAELEALARGQVDSANLWATFDRIVSLAEAEPLFVREAAGCWNATLARDVQSVFESGAVEISRRLFRLALAHRIVPNLCLAGGAALNSSANEACFRWASSSQTFRDIYLHPACGDDGTAIGAALFYWHHVLGNPRRPRSNSEAMYGVRTYERDVPRALESYTGDIDVRLTTSDVLEAARLIASGQVVGWYQGASEIGPRSLGNRSILCDPRRSDMQERLNAHVKFRERFRPFAPSVLRRAASDWFTVAESPFMLRVAGVRRMGIPAVTHCDGTARPQTVARRDNQRFYDLIEAFADVSGVELVLNTSLNIQGEPIAETPSDAIRCLLQSGMDCLVFPGVIVRKRQA